MPDIKQHVYEKLTAKERVAATIEALARGDKKERQRLVKSCPMRDYKITDPNYTDKMNALELSVSAVSADLSASALTFLFLNAAKGKHEEEPMSYVESMVAIKKAWNDVLEEQDIDAESMDKLLAEANNFVVTLLMQIAEKYDVEPDEDVYNDYKGVMQKIL